MRCPESERNFDAFISTEQKDSTFTWTVKWLLSVADALTISGCLKSFYFLVGRGVCLNILFCKL